MLVSTLMGCTQNDGYIGDIFGSWVVVDIQRDGNSIPDIKQSTLSFQNSIVFAVYADENHSAWREAGTFTLVGDKLTLDFTHTLPEADHRNLDWLYLPVQAVTDCCVTTLNSSKFDFYYIDREGVKYSYKFRRTW